MNAPRLIALVFSLLVPMSAAAASPAAVYAPVSHVYSPIGFDNNDETQVIVSGYLPNLCYKAPKAEVSVLCDTIIITMKALHEDRVHCAQAVVPYLEAVSVGVIPQGDYKIVVNAGSRNEFRSRISVGDARTSAVDDYIYGNINSIEKGNGPRKVLLKGYNPSDCFEFDRVEFVSNGKDAYSVMPIMKQVREHCPMKMVPMTLEAQVPADLKIENLLLHVRVMDGRSINGLFDNR